MTGRKLTPEAQKVRPLIRQVLKESGRITFGELCGKIPHPTQTVRQSLMSMKGLGEVETDQVANGQKLETLYFLTNWSLYRRKVGFCREWPFYQHHVTTGANPMLSRKWK